MIIDKAPVRISGYSFFVRQKVSVCPERRRNVLENRCPTAVIINCSNIFSKIRQNERPFLERHAEGTGSSTKPTCSNICRAWHKHDVVEGRMGTQRCVKKGNRSVQTSQKRPGKTKPAHLHLKGWGSTQRIKERKNPELTRRGGRARLVVVSVEVGGRFSPETSQFLRVLVSAKVRGVHPLKEKAAATSMRRWSSMLDCVVVNSFALSLLSRVLWELTVRLSPWTTFWTQTGTRDVLLFFFFSFRQRESVTRLCTDFSLRSKWLFITGQKKCSKREFIVDSGVSMHLLSKRIWTQKNWILYMNLGILRLYSQRMGRFSQTWKQQNTSKIEIYSWQCNSSTILQQF